MNQIIFFLGILVIFFAKGCKHRTETLEIKKEGNFNNGLKEGEWTYSYKVDKEHFTDTLNWKIETRDSFELNIPEHWSIYDTNEYHFYALPESLDSSQFFVVLKQRLNLSLKDYIKESFNVLRNQNGKFDYWLIKLTFKGGKNAYLVEAFVNEKYKILSFFLERKGFLFDFSFKSKSKIQKEVSLDYVIFLGVIQGYKEKGSILISGDEKIISRDTISIQDL